jgi:hypothetical protein
MDPAIDNGICNEAYDKLLTHEFHHEGGDFDEVNWNCDHEADVDVGATSLGKFLLFLICILFFHLVLFYDVFFTCVLLFQLMMSIQIGRIFFLLVFEDSAS